jgi:hypothetical protein
VNYQKTANNYNTSNNLTNATVQIWSATGGVYNWNNKTMYSHTYDGNNNQIELLHQDWNNSAWVNKVKYSYTYDGNNNQTEKLYQVWSVSAWYKQTKYSYTYDGNNNQTEELYQDWDGSAWKNITKQLNTYTPITAVNENLSSINSYSLSNNYPNPFNPSTKITYSIPERATISLKVFNLLGSEVAELVKGEIEAGKYNINFNASSLPSGVYFYRLQAGSFIQTRKMILLK